MKKLLLLGVLIFTSHFALANIGDGTDAGDKVGRTQTNSGTNQSNNAPVSCAKVVPVTVACGGVQSIKQLPFTYKSTCAGVTYAPKQLPLPEDTNCKVTTDKMRMVASVVCTKTSNVTCDPCLGVPCP